MARCDMFLKLVGTASGPINGESDDPDHKDEIEVDNWGWGMSAPAAAAGQSRARRQLKALTITKRTDRSSTALMNALSRNELCTATLTVRKAGGSSLPYFKIQLTKARVIEYAVDSGMTSEGAPALIERISFTFETILVTYERQSAAGAGEGGMEFEDSMELAT